MGHVASTKNPEAISISADTCEDLGAWFDGYVGRFLPTDPGDRENIAMKIEHSRSVQTEMCRLGSDLRLTECEQRLASVIGLLHDIGRFEQYTKYRTFNDRKSVNHAELGLQILDQEGVLHGLPVAETGIVRKAILYHNRPALPAEESAQTLFFSRMIRDADKLDIWRVCVDEYARTDGKRNEAIGFDLPDTPGYVDSIASHLARGLRADRRDLRNLNDVKLFQLGWVFDINFAPTFRRIQSRGIIDRIRESLRNCGDLESVFDTIHHHVRKGIED